MKILSENEIKTVHGGKTLETAELTNAYMMAGSMFFPVIGVATMRRVLPQMASTSMLGALVEGSIVAAGTWVGVWVGYQIYYMIYD